MNRIKLSQFGKVLTDRPFGKTVMQSLTPILDFPVSLDFTGVLSLGSSFGDEVVAQIAKNQGNKITAINPNRPVLACLQQIAEAHQLNLTVEMDKDLF